MKRVAVSLVPLAVLALGLSLFPGRLLAVLATSVAVALALLAWGVVSLRSGLLCSARWRGSGAAGHVALTYDDGPDPATTPALLHLLEERGVAVAFFCIGERVRANPELVRRSFEAGHLIGNHSDRHGQGTNLLFAGALRSELEACSRAIAEATGVAPRYYRPPFGLANHALGGVAKELSLEIVGWQVRGLDTPNSAPETVARRVLDRVRAGGIVLLHDGGRDPRSVVAATRAILDGLESRGLVPVRLDRLLEE